MHYSLSIFTKTEKPRVYINGTTRRAVYFYELEDGTLGFSSKVRDTPHKYQTGNHYQKRDKDMKAALEVAEAYGFEHGVTLFSDVMKVAQSGLQVEA